MQVAVDMTVILCGNKVLVDGIFFTRLQKSSIVSRSILPPRAVAKLTDAVDPI